MDSIQLTVIGRVQSDIISSKEAPKNYTESEKIGILEIFPAFSEGLDSITAGQTIVALFWLHNAPRDTLKVYPRGDKSRGLHGVFATRSPARPNPIGISELRIIARDGNLLTVKGLDMLNGTPLLDIKKKI